MAKKDRESRKKSANSDLYSACYEGSKFAWSKPVTTSGRNIASDFEKRPASSCSICGSIGGTFYIQNGRKFCREHRHMMYWPEIEIEKATKKELAPC